MSTRINREAITGNFLLSLKRSSCGKARVGNLTRKLQFQILVSMLYSLNWQYFLKNSVNLYKIKYILLHCFIVEHIEVILHIFKARLIFAEKGFCQFILDNIGWSSLFNILSSMLMRQFECSCCKAWVCTTVNIPNYLMIVVGILCIIFWSSICKFWYLNLALVCWCEAGQILLLGFTF